ncbi:MAG: trypsin-like peptidase domain-containing protein, partial [Gammaproteobacteria bacterium]|nr:trypsin-like peptidase domain-containing protein [Gammaproteobacteria bacterium]
MSRQPDQPALFPLMLPGSFNGLNPLLRRLCSRLLAVALLALALPMAANAQQLQPMSPSVVLVLKLVSATHVEPTTGIVVADNGLVLVPADFVLSGGEIIVLDGGTDIIKHGRPATIAKQPGSGNLALLSVSGLGRTGITFSENALNGGSELQLMAFPPAEYIAKGTPPVQVPAKVIQDGPDARFSVSPSTPLPYVSGPILDACGYLAGVSLTTGPQSLQPGKPALTLFADDLKQTLEAMQIILPSASCTYQSLKTVPSANTEQEGEIVQETSETDQSTSEGDEANLIGPEVYKPFIPKKRLNPFQGATPPPMPVDTAKPSVWRRIPLWLLLLGFISLVAISWKGFTFWRLHKGDVSPASDTNMTASEQAASKEPDTAPLQTAPDSMTGKPRS